MIPVSHFETWACRWVWMAFVASLGLASALFLVERRAAVALSGWAAEESGVGGVPVFALPPDLASLDWGIVQPPRRRGPVTPLAQRFRLAGTFSAYASSGTERRAILDDLNVQQQRIVSPGDVFDGVAVREIERDSVVLERESVRERLWLSFASGSPGAGRLAADAMAATAGAALDPSAAARARFGGRQIGESLWVFDRGRLLDYYRELRDEPARLVSVFDAMEPVYGEGGGIEGYRVKRGEEDAIFRAAALENGDIVRAVNSLQMTNRRRAEYFLEEFVSDRANAFVLEVERGGRRIKQTYQIR